MLSMTQILQMCLSDFNRRKKELWWKWNLQCVAGAHVIFLVRRIQTRDLACATSSPWAITGVITYDLLLYKSCVRTKNVTNRVTKSEACKWKKVTKNMSLNNVNLYIYSIVFGPNRFTYFGSLIILSSFYRLGVPTSINEEIFGSHVD
jgi:hypothetical protein